MTSSLKLHLRANERIFINGAVLRVDRKVGIEFLNNVQFLLENHVMQEADATTPLRQLYFVVQSMIIDPPTAGLAREILAASLPRLLAAIEDPEMRERLIDVQTVIAGGRPFEALKIIRGLYPIEARILATPKSGRSWENAIQGMVP